MSHSSICANKSSQKTIRIISRIMFERFSLVQITQKIFKRSLVLGLKICQVL